MIKGIDIKLIDICSLVSLELIKTPQNLSTATVIAAFHICKLLDLPENSPPSLSWIYKDLRWSAEILLRLN